MTVLAVFIVIAVGVGGATYIATGWWFRRWFRRQGRSPVA